MPLSMPLSCLMLLLLLNTTSIAQNIKTLPAETRFILTPTVEDPFIKHLLKDRPSFELSSADLALVDSLLLLMEADYNYRVKYGYSNKANVEQTQQIDSLLELERNYFRKNGLAKTNWKRCKDTALKAELQRIHDQKDSLKQLRDELFDERWTVPADSDLTEAMPLLPVMWTDKTIDLIQYARQLLPYINEKGEQVVYANCLCYFNSLEASDWRTTLVTGGDYYECWIQVELNLTKRIYENFRTN